MNIRAKNKRLEGMLQLSILQYLMVKGYQAGKTKTTGIKYGKIYHIDPYLFLGFPDITVFMPEIIFIEVKSPTGVLNPNQKLFQSYCKKAGIKYIVAKKMEDVMDVV